MECVSLERVGAWGFKFCTREIVHISLFSWYRIVFESFPHPVHSYIRVEAMTSTIDTRGHVSTHKYAHTCNHPPSSPPLTRSSSDSDSTSFNAAFPLMGAFAEPPLGFDAGIPLEVTKRKALSWKVSMWLKKFPKLCTSVLLEDMCCRAQNVKGALQNRALGK